MNSAVSQPLSVRTTENVQGAKFLTSYRADIDGLRGCAVLVVIAFHLNKLYIPGGFLGVDVFFVISGYLITKIIYVDLLSNNFSLSKFYQRRIARILPSFLTVGVSTLVAAAIIYDAPDLAAAGSSFAAATLFAVNIKYLLQGSYFDILPDTQPFLHYWSLAVEEQFYIVFPMLLIGLMRFSPLRRVAGLMIVCAISFVCCIALTYTKPTLAFFLLPTRFWELGAGSVLAILLTQHGGNNHGRIGSGAATNSALLLLALSTLLIADSDQFPGWIASIPVIATCILITNSEKLCLATRILESGPLVAVGKRSFAMYLWHWPIFSFVDYSLYSQHEVIRLITKVTVTAALTELTHRWIERPCRIKINRGSSKTALASAVLVLSASVFCGYLIRKNNYINADAASIANGGLHFKGAGSGPSVILLGDSNASMYAKTLREICATSCRSLNIMSISASDVLPPTEHYPLSNWANAIEFINRYRPDLVVIANHWIDKLERDPSRLRIATEALARSSHSILILTQPPILPNTATREAIRAGSKPPFFEDVEWQVRRDAINSELKKLDSGKVRVFDVSRTFRRADNSIEFVSTTGALLYQDATHLSFAGTQRLSGDLSRAINELAPRLD